jgi:hypothetical protein
VQTESVLYVARARESQAAMDRALLRARRGVEGSSPPDARSRFPPVGGRTALLNWPDRICGAESHSWTLTEAAYLLK